MRKTSDILSLRSANPAQYSHINSELADKEMRPIAASQISCRSAHPRPPISSVSFLASRTSILVSRLGRRQGTTCHAEEHQDVQHTTDAPPPKLQKTMAGLDALLGIVPEKADDGKSETSGNKAWRADTSGSGVGISQTALDKIAEAERQREEAKGGGSVATSDIESQMAKIVEKAKKLADEQAAAKKAAASSGTSASPASTEKVRYCASSSLRFYPESISTPPSGARGLAKGV